MKQRVSLTQGPNRLGQLDHTMQMLGQNHPAVYPEIMAASHSANPLPQGIELTGQQIVAILPQKIDREKISAARMPATCGAMPFGYCALHGLGTLGCDILQGYLFSRPLPANELEAFLRSR